MLFEQPEEPACRSLRMLLVQRRLGEQSHALTGWRTEKNLETFSKMVPLDLIERFRQSRVDVLRNLRGLCPGRFFIRRNNRLTKVVDQRVFLRREEFVRIGAGRELCGN